MLTPASTTERLERFSVMPSFASGSPVELRTGRRPVSWPVAVAFTARNVITSRNQQRQQGFHHLPVRSTSS